MNASTTPGTSNTSKGKRSSKRSRDAPLLTGTGVSGAKKQCLTTAEIAQKMREMPLTMALNCCSSISYRLKDFPVGTVFELYSAEVITGQYGEYPVADMKTVVEGVPKAGKLSMPSRYTAKVKDTCPCVAIYAGILKLSGGRDCQQLEFVNSERVVGSGYTPPPQTPLCSPTTASRAPQVTQASVIPPPPPPYPHQQRHHPISQKPVTYTSTGVHSATPMTIVAEMQAPQDIGPAPVATTSHASFDPSELLSQLLSK